MKKTSKKLKEISYLKLMADFWAILAMLMFTIDFFSHNKFDSASAAVGVIYLAILGVYVSDKEYARWKTSFISYYLGEGYIFLWTILIFILVIVAFFSQHKYKIPGDVTLTYIGVLAIYTLTRKSKDLKKKVLPKNK